MHTFSYISRSFQPSRRKSDKAGALFKDHDHLMIQEGYTGKQITKITQYFTLPHFSGQNRWNPGGIQVAGRNWSESGWIPTSFRVKIKEKFKLRFLSVPGHSRWNPSKVRVKKKMTFWPHFRVNSRSIPGTFQVHSFNKIANCMSICFVHFPIWPWLSNLFYSVSFTFLFC